MLTFDVNGPTVVTQFTHLGKAIEFGRGRQRDAERFVVRDVTVSRDHLHVEELDSDRIRAQNLSRKAPIKLTDGLGDTGMLACGESRELPLPVRLTLGEVILSVSLADGRPAESPQTIAVPARMAQSSEIPVLRALGESPTPEMIAAFLESILELQRNATDTADLYDQTARALVELLELDCGIVLIRDDSKWSVAARCERYRSRQTDYSRTLLNHVLQDARTFYQDLEKMDFVQSLRDVEAAVVSPIFSVRGEVAGALYGSRTHNIVDTCRKISSLEAQMAQLLAAAISSHLARTAAARSRSRSSRGRKRGSCR